jgi:hypothetical protein
MTESNHEDLIWQNLLSASAPTFHAETIPPYGFMTQAMARLMAEKGQRDLMERIGIRAIFASLAVVVLTLGVTLIAQAEDRGQLEPGMKNVLQVENVPVS